jgi:predicted DNA-binding transcriptional regulator AlpA
VTSFADKSNGDLPDRLVGTAERRWRVPVSDMTIWRWEKDGLFPKHIAIGGRNFWRDSDLRTVERGEWVPPAEAADTPTRGSEETESCGALSASTDEKRGAMASDAGFGKIPKTRKHRSTSESTATAA